MARNSVRKYCGKLEDIAAKCISSIIALRLKKHPNTFGIDGQCECLFGKGCTDATFAVKSAIQTLHEHNQQVYVLFVDLIKAFDSVNRELLWKILAVYGVPEKTIEVLKKLHTNVTYQFKVGKKLTKIEGNVGVKQGDNLGLILFIIMVNAVAKSLKKKWTFSKPTFQWHSMKADGSHKWNPKLDGGTSHKTICKTFEYIDSYYVDDAAYLLLNREDLERASILIKKTISGDLDSLYTAEITEQMKNQKLRLCIYQDQDKNQQQRIQPK